MLVTTNVSMMGPYPLASLYVGGLHSAVTEAQLFEKFSQVGPVVSIRVCRDAVTRRSLGYAYVNFQQPEHAKSALDTMNFDLMNGRSMRIMWSNRDPSARRSGTGNIFIKNLDKSIDHKALHDTFSLFGNILSCKVATDDNGESKGYGFVHFEKEDAALQAIDKVNGLMIADTNKMLFVGKFKPRSARMKELGESPHAFNNVFVKNFGSDLDNKGLQKLFEKFGPIESCVVMLDAENKSKGFGFVSFKKSEDALKAVQGLNDAIVDGSEGHKLTVCRAQKKSDRAAELKDCYGQSKIDAMQRCQGVNLYVKNLDDSVDDEGLNKLFAAYGKITSAKVMKDEADRSKGFGFVCFERQDEATRAQMEMNRKIMTFKPLYVATAQRKEYRRVHLASQYMQRLANARTTQGQMFVPAAGGYFVPMQNSYVKSNERVMIHLQRSMENEPESLPNLAAQHEQVIDKLQENTKNQSKALPGPVVQQTSHRQAEAYERWKAKLAAIIHRAVTDFGPTQQNHTPAIDRAVSSPYERNP